VDPFRTRLAKKTRKNLVLLFPLLGLAAAAVELWELDVQEY
jgi:hypothetical protein